MPFYITPDKGYTISDVIVDGSSVGAVTSYKFSKVKGNHTIKAVFKKKDKPTTEEPTTEPPTPEPTTEPTTEPPTPEPTTEPTTKPTAEPETSSDGE